MFARPGSGTAPRRRARILILVENLSVPFDRRVNQESQALVDAGHDVHVICPRGTKTDTEKEAVVNGVHIHRYRLKMADGGFLSFIREYVKALSSTAWLCLRHGLRRPFDVVHACNPPDLLLIAALPLRLRGSRFLFDHHDLVPELAVSRFEGRKKLLLRALRRAERITFRLADTVISTNESYREVAIERGGMPEDRVHVVRSAPDLTRFVTRPPDPSLKQGRTHLVCYLGVMGPQDGIDHALRALAHLQTDMGRDDVTAVFMGDGDVREDMIRLAGELGVGDHTLFTGRVSDEVVQTYLSTADVAIAPDPKTPLNDVSTMNKIVEYMAMGCPVVSYDLIEARVSGGEAAVYVTPDDPKAMAEGINELLDDPPRRARMGAIGRRRLEEELSWEHSRRHLLEAYAQILGG